ncbi:Uncharacterised protein [Vibrio cholerae]|nr:Uncharacterised protein [Vibrio cholerae]CSI46661.1 Uncharacterised protein [Vibrio cholerae]
MRLLPKLLNRYPGKCSCCYIAQLGKFCLHAAQDQTGYLLQPKPHR